MTILMSMVVFVLGGSIVVATLASAIKTFVLPRSAPDKITRICFIVMRRIFDLRIHFTSTYAERDRIMALFAPVSLVLLPIVWLTLVLIGYMSMFWALGIRPWRVALSTSGSSLLTLGFASLPDLPATLIAFSEAAIGLILVALLISYLPTMYGAFSRREAVVTLLEIRAGSPPSAVTMIQRFSQLQRLDQLNEVWVT